MAPEDTSLASSEILRTRSEPSLSSFLRLDFLRIGIQMCERIAAMVYPSLVPRPPRPHGEVGFSMKFLVIDLRINLKCDRSLLCIKFHQNDQ